MDILLWVKWTRVDTWLLNQMVTSGGHNHAVRDGNFLIIAKLYGDISQQQHVLEGRQENPARSPRSSLPRGGGQWENESGFYLLMLTIPNRSFLICSKFKKQLLCMEMSKQKACNSVRTQYLFLNLHCVLSFLESSSGKAVLECFDRIAFLSPSRKRLLSCCSWPAPVLVFKQHL